MLAPVPIAASDRTAGQVFVRRVAGNLRRNESAKDDDRRRPDRGRGMMQAALGNDRELDAGQGRGRLAEGLDLDNLDADQAVAAVARLIDRDPIVEQHIGDPLIALESPILIDGNRFLPRDIRLDQDARPADGELELVVVEIELAWRRNEIIIPKPAPAAAWIRSVIAAASLVIANPLDVGRCLARDVGIIPESLLAPWSPNQAPAVAESDEAAALGGAARHSGRHDLISYTDDRLATRSL